MGLTPPEGSEASTVENYDDSLTDRKIIDVSNVDHFTSPWVNAFL